MMNLREFGDYYNDFVASGFGGIKEDPYYSDVSLLGKGTNWQDAIFQTAFQQVQQQDCHPLRVRMERIHQFARCKHLRAVGVRCQVVVVHALV